MLAQLLLVITYAASTPDPVDVFAAPTLDPWPQGLALPYQAGDGAWCLPPDRANAARDRLVACDQLAPRCQARLDAAKILLEPPKSWPTWAIVSASVVAFGLGAGVVILAR